MQIWRYIVVTYSFGVYAFLAVVPWYEAALCGAALTAGAWLVWLLLYRITLPFFKVFFQLSSENKLLVIVGIFYLILFFSMLPSTSFWYAALAPLFVIALLAVVLTAIGYVFVPMIDIVVGSFLLDDD